MRMVSLKMWALTFKNRSLLNALRMMGQFLILNDVSIVEEYFHSIFGILAEYCLVKCLFQITSASKHPDSSVTRRKG